MIGAVINSAGIVAGGIVGLAMRKPLSGHTQTNAKIFLGAAVAAVGLRLTWKSLNGSFTQVMKELAIVLLAMSLGKMIGRLLRLQSLFNRVGQYATRAMTEDTHAKRFGDGFLLASALFCLGPMGILASLYEGLNDFSPLFVVKAGVDGLATMSFCAAFGWSPIIAALPALAFQGAMIRGAQLLEPVLRHQAVPMLDAVNATNGLLIFCLTLIVLEIRKVRVAEYLPSLILAPLLTRWLW